MLNLYNMSFKKGVTKKGSFQEEKSTELTLYTDNITRIKTSVKNVLGQQMNLTDEELNKIVELTIKNVGNINNLDTPVLKVLKKIHVNSVFFSIYHNKRFWIYKNVLFFIFRLPLIILSAFNSFFAVGMQDQLAQTTISMANALISLFCGIITSIELFLNLNKKMEVELTTYKSFYALSIDIYQFVETTNFNVSEPNKQKNIDDKFNEMYNRYKELVNSSNAINVYNINFDDSLELKNDITNENKNKAITTNQYCCNKISCFKEMCLCCP